MLKSLAVRRITWALLLLSTSCCLSATDTLPRLTGETLAGTHIVLPDALKGKPVLLVLSFARAAEEQSRGWTEQLKKNNLGVERYNVLELEDVPRLFRGFVKSGIRKGVPEAAQGSFVLLYDNQEQLKKLTSFEKDYEVYVLLLDANGNIQWREHGAVDEKKMAALGKELGKK